MMQAVKEFKPKTKDHTLGISIAITMVLILIVSGSYYLNNKEAEVKLPPILDEAALRQTNAITPAEVNKEITKKVTAAGSATNTAEAKAAATKIAVIKAAETKIAAIKIAATKSATTQSVDLTDEFILPALDESNDFVLTAVRQLSALPAYANLLIKEEIIRNLVVFIDNLSRGELVQQFSPLIRSVDNFSVLKRNEDIFLDPQSYHRYDLYVDIINSIDVEFAARLYRLLAPLFNDAYQELGYPENDFERSLSKAIKTLLDAPIVDRPMQLLAPSVMYKFAASELEKLPAAQKLMLRMGPENTIKLQTKLQQIQLVLAGF